MTKRFWVQWPLYWGVEDDAVGKPVSVAWLAQFSPPFFHGKALRFRVGDRAIHVGLCRKAKRPFVRPGTQTPEEIGVWHS